jgi:hypothetical protein
MRSRNPFGHVTRFSLVVVAIRILLVAPMVDAALMVPAHADPIFSPPFLWFDLAGSPRGVATADLNGDGRPDLAIAGSSSNTVVVLLGNGDGTFAPRIDLRVGDCPLAVAIGDLNVDGRPDLAVANACSRTVSLLLGNGDGTFGAKTDFSTGANPYSVAIADFNVDGRPDVAVANYLSNDVSVLLGNGDGTLAPKIDFRTGSGPLSVAIADFNRDGWPDLVTANFNSSRVSVLLGNGDGTFATASAFSAGVTPRSVAIADVNVDGIPDLGAAVFYEYTLSVLLGNGDGTFGTNRQFAVGRRPEWVAMADLNADGWPDAAVANGLSGTVSVLLGNGDGTFGTATDFEIGDNPFSVAIADFNRDGGLDLAVVSGGRVTVLLNRSVTPVEMAFDLEPNTLNLASHGLWVTGFLEPVSPYAAEDIDVSSVLLNGTVCVAPTAPSALADHDANGIPDLMVKFNRAAVGLAVGEGDSVLVEVTGTVGGRLFSGVDYIRVRRAVVSAPLGGSHLAAGSVAQVCWQTPNSVVVESVALLHTLDGGRTWSLIANGEPNSWSYDWTVPNVATDQAKVAVVLVESADETGNVVTGVLGVSEAFSIDALVGVGDGSPPRLMLRGVTPNPARQQVAVSFSLGGSGIATLTLFDVVGRQLETRRVDGMGPGWHRVALGGHGNLPSGLYIIRLIQGGQSLSVRAAVVR